MPGLLAELCLYNVAVMAETAGDFETADQVGTAMCMHIGALPSLPPPHVAVLPPLHVAVPAPFA